MCGRMLSCSSTSFNSLPDCFTGKVSVMCCEPFVPCLISYIVARFAVVCTCFPDFLMVRFTVWIDSSLFISLEHDGETTLLF